MKGLLEFIAHLVIGLGLVLIIQSSVFAQNPDLVLSQAERDSLLKNYDQIFPIWGKKVIEKGFDLPHPAGINLNYLYMDQGILISNLGLSTSDNPIQTTDFIKFADNKSKVSSVNARFDLWLFPFLNVYSIFGQGRANTKVKLVEPIEFESGVDQSAQYYGFGLTGAMGIKQNWLSFDINWTWANLEKLKDPVRGRVLGIRYGRTFKLSGKKRFAVWVGTMNQKFETITEGSVLISEVMPPEVRDRLQDYQNSGWYQELSPGRKEIVNGIMDDVLNRYDTAKINYRLDKKPADPWNLLLGANFELNKSWQIRAEAGMIGRFSFLLNANYRFKL